MYFLAPDGNIYDDGRGDWSHAYGVAEDGRTYALGHFATEQLTTRYYAEHPPAAIGSLKPEAVAEIRSRFPIGDVIAKLTGAAGIQPCAPCKRRQAALNQFGERVAGVFNRR